MRITLAASADLPAILVISNHAAHATPANFATEPETLDAWQRAFDDTSPRYPWLVARHQDEIVGFAKAGPHRARGAYAWSAEVTVYIRPDRHRRGIGRALYDHLIPMLRDQGYAALLAGITLPNPASVHLHERFGFVHCGTYYRIGWKHGAWHDVGYWELVLTSGDGPPAPLRSVAEGADAHLE